MSQTTRLEVSMDRQTLDLYVNDEHVRTFNVSTAEKGMGFAEGSFRTPTGRFVISENVWGLCLGSVPNGAVLSEIVG